MSLTTEHLKNVGADHRAFFLMAGPCVIESEEHCLKMGKAIKKICDDLGIFYIFKASFDKANRTSVNGFRGQGIEEGLRILAKVKSELGVPIVTDVHEHEQCAPVGLVADILQIPAFLCRQTDLLLAAGNTGKIINIKKGQFCSSITMTHAYEKVASTGNTEIMLCDRGTMFGYGDLIVDMRNLALMREQNPHCLIVQDITHALQQPNVGDFTHGCRWLIPTIARGAVASGVDGIFMEVHDNPEAALSDKATQWPLDKLQGLLEELLEIHRATRGRETHYVN